MIKISNLNKVFNKGKKNELHVLKDLSYEFPDTGLVSILGESGSGKSTLINIIGGLLYHDEDIIIDDKVFNNKNIKELEEYRNNNIGYIFQSYLVYKDLSVYDNLKLSLNVLNINDEEEIDKRINYVLEILNLTKYKKKKASELSGGEQQRLSIARALIKKCKIYICDEPTGNLDTKNSIIVMNILKSLAAHSLVILVTHNPSLAKQYSDIIIHMSDGQFVNKDVEDTLINTNSVNNLYLEDFNKSNISNNNISVDYYSNSDNKLNVTLLYKDNKLYIDTKGIEVISNATIYEKRETFEESISNFNYDNSFYKDIYSKDTKWYKLLFNNLFKFKKKTKKDVLLNVCSILLSVIIMFLMFMASAGIENVVNASTLYDDITYINSENKLNSKSRVDAMIELSDRGAITNISVNTPYNIEFKYNVFPGQQYHYSVASKLLMIEDNPKMLYGNVSDDGVVISEALYNELVQRYNLKVDDVLNGSITLYAHEMSSINGINTKITGIKKGGRSFYSTYNFLRNSRLEGNTQGFNYKFKSEYSDYKVIEELSMTLPNMLIPAYVEKSSGLYLGQNINDFYVYGIIEDNNDIDKLVVIDDITYKGEVTDYNSAMLGYVDLYTDDIRLLEGRIPSNFGEVLVPNDSKLRIGDSIVVRNYEYKIVGNYDSLQYGNHTLLGNPLTVLCNTYNDNTYFSYKIVDTNIHNEILNKYNLYAETDKAIIFDNVLDTSQIILVVIYLLFIVLDIVLMYIINRVTFYNNKNSFLIIRSISGNTNYIKKRYLTAIIANNIKYLLLPMLIIYLLYYYLFNGVTKIILTTLLFILTFIILCLSSLIINYIYINKQLKKEPLFLERKYDL